MRLYLTMIVNDSLKYDYIFFYKWQSITKQIIKKKYDLPICQAIIDESLGEYAITVVKNYLFCLHLSPSEAVCLDRRKKTSAFCIDERI